MSRPAFEQKFNKTNSLYNCNRITAHDSDPWPVILLNLPITFKLRCMFCHRVQGFYITQRDKMIICQFQHNNHNKDKCLPSDYFQPFFCFFMYLCLSLLLFSLLAREELIFLWKHLLYHRVNLTLQKCSFHALISYIYISFSHDKKSCV